MFRALPFWKHNKALLILSVHVCQDILRILGTRTYKLLLEVGNEVNIRPTYGRARTNCLGQSDLFGIEAV